MTVTNKLPPLSNFLTNKNDFYHTFLNSISIIYLLTCILLFLIYFIIIKRSFKSMSIIICCIFKILISYLFIDEFLNFIYIQKYDFNKESITINKYITSTLIFNKLPIKLQSFLINPFTTSPINTFHFYLLISFFSISLYFIISYILYGIEYKSSSSQTQVEQAQTQETSPIQRISNEIRIKLLNTIFKGNRIAIVEILVLVWIYSLLSHVLEKPTTVVDYGKSKKVLVFCLLSLISFGYLLLNIRNRSKNLQIKSESDVLKLASGSGSGSGNNQNYNNLIISKNIIIHKLNESFSQFIYYSTMYYFSITLFYYSISISTNFWKLSTDTSNTFVSASLSTFQSITNALPIIDILFTLVFIIHSIQLIYYYNKINLIDKSLIEIKKLK